MNKAPLILVADDDQNDLRMIADVLDRAGDATRRYYVSDGAEALDFLHRRGAYQDRPPGPPGLVLLDLNMPRIDGWEVLRQVKHDAALGLVPIVVFSSSAREADVRACYEFGANAYAVKPIDFQEFRRTVAAVQAFWLECNQPPPAAGRRREPPPSPRRRLPRVRNELA
ncbi:MAG TPA: response regulator [Lacunisphaera sp.]|jgi:CheY-like chemotaxis protein|nr:response regulator [Lacunisphaera sp.]